MKHLGDITKINGAYVPRVEVVIGGSPCQDLSVAGKRAGLAGERSGLFMEQIRIIKEMRARDEADGRTDTDVFPRWMVFENVPGLFSSNGGEDFRAVLEETVRIAEPTAVIPRYEGGRWTNAGVIIGNGFSVAWRTHDAQYWGVPQRRRRISLVADFGGGSAPEILFESESLRGDSQESGEAREGAAGDAENGIGDAVPFGICSYESNSMKSDNPYSGFYQADTSRTLDNNGGNPACNQGGIAVVYENHAQDCRYDSVGNVAPTCVSRYGTGGGNMPIVVSIGNGQTDNMRMSETANTLDCMHDQQAVMIKEENDATGTQDQVLRILQEAYGEKAVVEWGVAILAALQSAEVLQQEMHDSCDERETENWNELDDGSLPCSELVAGWMLRDMREQSERRCSSQGQQSEKQRFEQSSKAVQVVPSKSTQNCKEMFNMWRKGKGLGLLRQALSKIQETREPSCSKEKRSYYTVRRLTPLEVERLQGFPDGWTDIGDWTDSKGKVHHTADSARYKALGNSIALPFWFWMLKCMNEYCQAHTMASLFDGIGGFPLCWETINGKGSCLWASEIEEFPIAVTKRHFGEEKKS